MGYATLYDTVRDLEKHGRLIRVSEEIDSDLEMAAVHRRINAQQGPALFFENIKGRDFPAVSNLFGTGERSHFLFRDSFSAVREVLQLRKRPMSVLNPRTFFSAIKIGVLALPRPAIFAGSFDPVSITRVPVTKSWPKDGGNFVTLPLVYTEHPEHPGVMRSNLGMYRVQTSGNSYSDDQTMGIHYQLHRGIGIHHTAAAKMKQPLKVTVIVGGPPALMLAAVMPLPETISELIFASMLGRRMFRYRRRQGYLLSPQADFFIHGEISPNETLPEGPFGDHLGYYSLTHDFPVLRVKKILARRRHAIWPFTVVGRPPQEDSAFGRLIHELTDGLIENEIPGVRAVHAVDAAGVHPLLLAVGSERYMPYLAPQPREILTQANAILGFNQMSLAKYLFIAAEEGAARLSVHRVEEFLRYVLERLDFSRDLHFQTRTTMDTLDYSGGSLNEGSKLVLAAYGPKLRELATEIPARSISRYNFRDVKLAMPGVLAVRTTAFKDYKGSEFEMRTVASAARPLAEAGIALVVLVDDAEFAAQSLDNFLWVTFTRSDPARDIYGVEANVQHKHWGCKAPLIIDARVKHHHAGVLTEDPKVTQRIERFFRRDASLGKFSL
ncbi:UbiD family decarboxylase [Turneriella parva]|uniref:Carboxylyase-related protein n=1 Tax=Turneriella parva (strain ATCC BAA-1111 / DSM 21527 / NCTC 11395 / H) TaxID=869212 RepID=I4B9C4_TURPD|nr:UbiD family decarboxylase [Turneriella parva]AFM13881.1 Carboxylyase-related protein [Turneriella parva DSM 21527]